MAHHGDRPDEMSEVFRKLLDEKSADFVANEREALLKQHLHDNVGPTGKFPEGKVCDRDEGEIAFAVGVEDGKIVLNFGS